MMENQKPVAELMSYLQLPVGWDGVQSIPPILKDIEDAIAVIKILPSRLSDVKTMVSSSGQVGLYWDRENFYLDMEFEGKAILSLFSRHKFSKQEVFVSEIRLSDINNEWFEKYFPL